MRVMASPAGDSDGMQPYTELLYGALRDRGLRVESWGNLQAVSHPPDVIHIHWPEHRLGRRDLRSRLRALAFLLALTVARLRGATVVYTGHNTLGHDHDDSRFDRVFIAIFDRLVDVLIVLSSAGSAELLSARPGLNAVSRVHVRHGTFRDAYPATPARSAARSALNLERDVTTVVFAGQVRPYKGVVDLIRASRGLQVQVLVAGSCPDDGLRSDLEREAAKSTGQVHLRLHRLDPSEMATVVGAADLVALPYRHILNSGSALLALGFDRPIVVPDTPTFSELAGEVGEQWVRRFQGNHLVAEDLEGALEDLPEGSPDLSAHDWDLVAAATIEAYQQAK